MKKVLSVFIAACLVLSLCTGIFASVPTARAATLSIGDSYGGGKVAYILQNGDPGYVEGETRGLIAATADQNSLDNGTTNTPWALGGNQSLAVPGGTLTTLGSGSANTDNIIAQNGEGRYAAGLARAYTGGGYSDWYLPSKDELNKLYLNRASIGGFVAWFYASSSEYYFPTYPDSMWVQNFNSGTTNSGTKNNVTYLVRAVRSFMVSSDATLKATSTVKGQAVTSLGTPHATLGSEASGAVTITLTQAANTSNAGSFITLFDKTDAGATVKVVKYATGVDPTPTFATDTAYANDAITTADFFIVRVTAQDGTTILYYKVVVTATLSIGDSYGGGKVAYILQNGDPGYVEGETRGLIAATADQNSLDNGTTNTPWALGGNQSLAVPGGTLTTLGSGSANTDNIIAQNGEGRYAAGLARAYTGGGYSDWYLPSKDELNKLYLNRASIGGFVAWFYASSSEYYFPTYPDSMWVQNFNSGTTNSGTKNNVTYLVRAVRSFMVSSDATLKATSTVKGQAVTSLGTPHATLGSEASGAVTITLTQAANTSNAGSFITLFDKTDAGATVKVVKYATGVDPTPTFATDTAYANDAITTADFFIVRVTAQDGTTILYYKVVVTATLSIGDSYGGGKVAYILQNGDPGYVEGETRGLIAATADQNSLDNGTTNTPWALGGNQSLAVPGGTLTTLGSGSANTDNIIAQNGEGRYAAGLARAYTGGGYSDWYLPSKDELNKLYLNRASIGGFVAWFYASSSEYYFPTYPDSMWVQNFNSGTTNSGTKNNVTYLVRAVRSFSSSDVTVTFNRNGGDTEASPTTRTTNYNTTVTLPTPPTRTGYHFDSWNTQANGTGSTFDGSTLVTADITVYAQWHINQYTVTFDRNGGDTEASPTTRTTNYNTTVTLPTPPTRTGYHFDSWNTQANGTGSTFDGSTLVTADITVYAQWHINQYTVTFNRNGGDTEASPTTRTTNYNTTVTLPTPPTRTGYHFDSWNTQANGTGSTFDGSTLVTADITVYAQWHINQYTVTFDRNGGDTEASPTTRTTNYNTTVTLPTPPTRTGYHFDSWNTQANGTGSTFDGSTLVTADITVYAQWHINQYTVTFDRNGGDTEASPTTRTTNYNTTVTLPTPPTRTGYHFDSWNTQANGTGSTFDGSTLVTADITVYAQWHINQYTVTFDRNGGDTEASPTTRTTNYNTTVTLPTPPTRTGYHFDSWNTQANGTGSTFDGSTLVTADITVYAQWHINQYTVTFDRNGGDTEASPTTRTTNYNTTVTLPTPPTRTGYHFDSWNTQANGTGSTFDGSTLVTADITVYAQWHINQYTVTFDRNGGDTEASPTTRTTNYNTTVTLPTPPTRTGYHFDSWNTQANGTGSTFDGSTLVTADITVYAQWHINQYTVTFDRNGGDTEASPTTRTTNYNTTVTLPTPPTRTGYHFDSWNTQANGTGSTFDGSTLVTADITVYAQWHINQYTVTFDRNGGDTEASPTTRTTNYNTTVTLPTPPTRTGYHFDSWNTQANGTGSTFDGSTLVTADITVYAQWHINQYTVTFDRNGGDTEASPTTRTTNYNTTVTLPTPPTRTGYHFDSWNTQANGTGSTFDGSTLVTADITVYAQWHINQYTVTFDRNGGDTEASPTTRTTNYNTTVTLPTPPTRTGYHFDSWNTQANGTGSTFDGSTLVTADITVYAQWHINQYTVTFDRNGGDTEASPTTRTTNYNTTVTLPTPPTRTGYHFDSWNTQANGTGSTFDGSTLVTADITVYAQWHINQYTVTFDRNGGDTEASPTTRTTNYNTTVTLPTPPTRTGYHFDSWNTQANGTGSTFDGSTLVTADITVYAQWHINQYTVTFDRNGGDTEASPTTRTTNYNTTVTLPTPPTRTGYHFDSWNTQANGTGSTFDGSTLVTADITVYAQWHINQYTVTFDRNGGDTEASPTTRTTNYNTTVTLPTPPTRTGYHFDSWNTQANGTGSTFDGSTLVTADITVYAQWHINQYTVTFDGNGGGTPSPTSKQVTYASTYGTLATVTRTGYTLTGWFTAASGGSEVTSATTVAITAPQTLYAQWTINSYTVTVTSGPNGRVTPGTGTVGYHTTQAYAVNPNPGYLIDTVTVDGVIVREAAGRLGFTLTLTDITAPHTIAATFRAISDVLSPIITIPDFSSLAGVTGWSGGTVPSFTVGSSPFPLQFTLEDNSGSVKWTIKVNGVIIIDPAGTGLITYPIPLSEGRNDVEVIATDAAGNSASRRLVIYLDSTGPALTIEPALPASVTTPRLTIAGTVADAVSGLKWVRINGMVVIPFLDGSFLEMLTLAKGANALVIEAEDKVGHKTSTTYTVTYVTAIQPLPTATIITLTIGKATMSVNGMAVVLDTVPFIKESRTMLPIRAIAEAISASVEWDPVARKVTITGGSTKIELWIGKSIARLNGKSVSIDAANSKVVPYVTDGRTLLPIRFVAEALGLDVEWNASTRVVKLTLQP